MFVLLVILVPLIALATFAVEARPVQTRRLVTASYRLQPDPRADVDEVVDGLLDPADAKLSRARLGLILGLLIVGSAMIAGSFVIQASAAEKASEAKLRETVAVECVKGVIKDKAPDELEAARPIIECGKAKTEWQDAAAAQARADGSRAALAALGLTLLGLGVGDGFAKYIFGKV